jgi:hypothetical protein
MLNALMQWLKLAKPGSGRSVSKFFNGIPSCLFNGGLPRRELGVLRLFVGKNDCS